MECIKIEKLSKHFKTLKRQEGLIGALKDLFSRDYAIVKAVENISLKIAEGEIVGFVGPNGAGKSTTIKMLTGVLEPTSGSIEVDGYIPYKHRKKYIKNVGVVFGQRTQLWWDIPVIESFKLLKEIYQIDTAIYYENMALFNDLVGLKELYNKPVRTLSLGQRMLCDITASFLHNPKIIFLDEPTIGLDVAIKSKIRKIIRDLNEIKKTTILLTSHDIGDIEKLCKRIILIDKGTIIYDGAVKRFNTLFGSYRTLQVAMQHGNGPESSKENITDSINQLFIVKEPIPVVKKESGWIDITVNQDEIQLLDVLNHVMENFPVKDIKIKEIELENVIQKVYEENLYEQVSACN